MTTAIIGASGVAQPKKISNGVGDLCERLAALPGLHVEYTTYRANVLQMATRIAHELEADRIIGCGHSAGGRWIVDLCWELATLSCRVSGIFLADAWQHRDSLVIPWNVAYCESWTQSNNRPRGSRIELYDSDVTEWVHHPGQLVRHAQVDELPEFQDAVISFAKGSA